MRAALMAPPSPHRLRTALAASLLTVVTIAGAIVFVFLVWSSLPLPFGVDHSPLGVQIAVGIPWLFVPIFAASGLWGLGVGVLAGGARWRAARAGALSVTGMAALLELPVHFSQALPPAFMEAFPLRVHGLFTAVFTVEVALVAGVASVRVARRIGVEGAWRVGRIVGACAAAGFLVGSLAALALGYRVDHGGMRMVWALFVAAGAASAAAGWALGWFVAPLRHADTADRT